MNAWQNSTVTQAPNTDAKITPHSNHIARFSFPRTVGVVPTFLSAMTVTLPDESVDTRGPKRPSTSVMKLVPATDEMFQTPDGRPTARSFVFLGIDPDEYRLLRKRVLEQGHPTINRATRRYAQRTGDKARRAKARRANR
jgi:hypothetical protein